MRRGAIAVAVTLGVGGVAACPYAWVDPVALARQRSVVVVVGQSQPSSGGASMGGGRLVFPAFVASLRRELLEGLRHAGWRAEALEWVPTASVGAYYDPQWPPELCTLVESFRMGAVLWVVPYLSWESGMGGVRGGADVTAHLVACPGNKLLWRDRHLRNLTIGGRAGLVSGSVLGPSWLAVEDESLARLAHDIADAVQVALARPPSAGP